MFNFHGGVAIRFWQNIMRQGYYSTYIIAISFIPCHRHPTADIPRPPYTHTQLVNPLNCADDCYQLLFVGGLGSSQCFFANYLPRHLFLFHTIQK